MLCHDEEVFALAATFPDIVQEHMCDRVPQEVRLALEQAGVTLDVTLRLPSGYPGARLPMLFKPHLRNARGSLEPGEEDVLHARMQSWMDDPCHDGQCLIEFTWWLQNELLPELVRNLGFDDLEGDSAREIEQATASPQEASRKDPHVVVGDPRPVTMARFFIWIHHHAGAYETRGWGDDYNITRLHCGYPEVTGFLSFGKPAALIAEGPADEVRRFIGDVRRFNWKDIREKGYEESEPLLEPDEWRAFDGFRKLHTGDVQKYLAQVGRSEWWDMLMVRNYQDQAGHPSGRKGRRA